MKVLRQDSVPGRAILHLEEVLRENNICILNVGHLEIHGKRYRIIDISGGSTSAQLPRCFEEERFMLLEDEV